MTQHKIKKHFVNMLEYFPTFDGTFMFPNKLLRYVWISAFNHFHLPNIWTRFSHDCNEHKRVWELVQNIVNLEWLQMLASGIMTMRCKMNLVYVNLNINPTNSFYFTEQKAASKFGFCIFTLHDNTVKSKLIAW